MESKELKEIRKTLGLTQIELANSLDVSSRTIQLWEGGKQKIPTAVAQVLLQKISIHQSKENIDNNISMDVSNKEILSLEDMINFCLRNKKEFLNHPSIKLLIDLNRKEAAAELLEKHIILRNNKNNN